MVLTLKIRSEFPTRCSLEEVSRPSHSVFQVVSSLAILPCGIDCLKWTAFPKQQMCEVYSFS